MSSWAGPGLGDTGHRGDVTVSVPAELLLRSNHGTEPQEGGRERQGPRQTAEDAAQLTTRGALLGELRFFLKNMANDGRILWNGKNDFGGSILISNN